MSNMVLKHYVIAKVKAECLYQWKLWNNYLKQSEFKGSVMQMGSGLICDGVRLDRWVLGARCLMSENFTGTALSAHELNHNQVGRELVSANIPQPLYPFGWNHFLWTVKALRYTWIERKNSNHRYLIWPGASPCRICAKRFAPIEFVLRLMV